jgi:hypothetical protein
VGNRRGTGGTDAVHEATTLEEMIAERVSQEATRIAEKRVREIVWLSDLDTDEGEEGE